MLLFFSFFFSRFELKRRRSTSNATDESYGRELHSSVQEKLKGQFYFFVFRIIPICNVIF